jgi:hypothetical protein
MNRRFAGTCHLHLQGRKSAEQEINDSRRLNLADKFPQRRFIYGLHGAIFKKMAILMTLCFVTRYLQTLQNQTVVFPTSIPV